MPIILQDVQASSCMAMQKARQNTYYSRSSLWMPGTVGGLKYQLAKSAPWSLRDSTLRPVRSCGWTGLPNSSALIWRTLFPPPELQALPAFRSGLSELLLLLLLLLEARAHVGCDSSMLGRAQRAMLPLAWGCGQRCSESSRLNRR